MSEKATSPGPGVGETRESQRRTIIKGAAWSLPVIAMTAAAPAHAASQCTPLTAAEKSTLLVTRNDNSALAGRTTQGYSGGSVYRWGYPLYTTVTWTWTVTNTGTAPIPAGIVVTLQIGRNPTAWGNPAYTKPSDFSLTTTLGPLSNRTQGWRFTSTAPLAPGQTRTFTASAYVPAGSQGSISTTGSAASPLHCDDQPFATVTNNGSPLQPQFVLQDYAF